MKKIISVIAALFFICVIAYLVYLNEAVLPKKLRTAVIKGLTLATDKTVTLSSAKLDIFRGLVLKDLSISDEKGALLSSKAVSCKFLILPVFKKHFTITALMFESPEIAVERMPDNSINIVELFFKKPVVIAGEYQIEISKITLSGGLIHFRDDTLDPVFSKDLKNLRLDLNLSLPGSVVFKADFELPSQLPAFVKMKGEYKIAAKEFSSEINARDIFPKELSPYLKAAGLEMPDGKLDASINMLMKGGILDCDIKMTSLELSYFRDRMKALANCAVSAKLKYDFAKKELIYTGELDMKNLSLSGLDYVESIGDIRGKVIFSDAKVSSKEITCTVFGLPVKASMEVPDLRAPVLKINADSNVGLSTLKDILKSRFDVSVPVDMKGDGALHIELQYKLPSLEPMSVSGRLDTTGAVFKLEQGALTLENLTGRIAFTDNQLIWSGLVFKYNGTDYNTSGVLTNFDKPGIDIRLDSKQFSAQSLLAVNDKFITLSKCEGHYEDIVFSVFGDLDASEPSGTKADIQGTLTFNLDENKEPFRRLKDTLKNSKPSGYMTAAFTLKGYLNDLDKCAIDAELSSDSVHLYGFRFDDFKLSCTQRNGALDIIIMRAYLYGGALDASGKVDFISKEKPYQINARIEGMKIEKLKKDTAFRDNDIAGSVKASFGLKGRSDDLSKLDGWGKINITNGKLWQLNLFRGLGSLVFRKDYTNVIFREGSCDFAVKDKFISTGDLILNSDLIILSGVVKVGFDNSINASLKTEFTDEGVDASKSTNAAAAIERYSIIEVSGTLKDPKFKIRPDLSSVVSDIAENFFQKK